ncbi:MAG: FAD-dependent oxidoreductase [Lysobacterales bacterium CG02_land_8_20_14_3_00_62_12]|nr:MAG: FAD-dependent oxidoreductase [Xanthomonadales bacterium CG02_land_8_20_14_3_00_62_12]
MTAAVTQAAPSWYAASANALPAQPSLRASERADVVVLGAGITGLSTAIELAERGYSVIVLEAETIGWGASGRSGGQMIFGYGCEQHTLRNLVGADDARKLFDWSREGLRLIGERVAKYRIDCDLQAGHAHAAIKPRQVEELKLWQADLQDHYAYPDLQFWDRQRLRQTLATERYQALLFDPAGGHLHPLNYTLGLARAALSLGVKIYQHSKVLAVQEGARVVFRTAQGDASGSFAVLAGNAWLGGLVPSLEAKIMPVGTYICATECLGAERARALIQNRMAVADINFVLDYFRLSGDHRMLFGGRVSYSRLPPPNLRHSMRQRLLKVFPQLADVAIDYVWGGYVDISMNRAPHWGRQGANLYFAQGFSGHGIAATGLAGRVIAEAIHGQSARLDIYQRIRHRDFPGGKWLRTPALVLAMLWYRLRDWR